MSGMARNNLNKIYRDFTRICEQWPVDSSRTGRDFGEHIRTSIGASLKKNDEVDHDKAKRTVEALARISTNYYKNKYPRDRQIGFTTQEEHVYQKILSNDGQAQVQPHRTWWERLSGKSKLGERMRGQK